MNNRKIPSRGSSLIPPGRPITLSKLERKLLICSTAGRMFMERGYEATSMEEIARRTGMSKRTLYALFPDKGILFNAVIGDLEEFPFDQAMPTSGSWPTMVNVLRQRMLAIARFALSERQVQLTRLIIAEANTHPDLARTFRRKVVNRAVAYVVDGIRVLQKYSSALSAQDPEWVGMTIYSAAMGNLHLYRLFGRSERQSNQDLLRRIDAAMALVGINGKTPPKSRIHPNLPS